VGKSRSGSGVRPSFPAGNYGSWLVFFCALTPHPALLLSLGYGSIRALTARSPGPLSLKKKKSSGGSTADDADWDESEDEVIAAFATSGTPQAGPGGVTSPPPKYAAWLALS